MQVVRNPDNFIAATATKGLALWLGYLILLQINNKKKSTRAKTFFIIHLRKNEENQGIHEEAVAVMALLPFVLGIYTLFLVFL